MAIDDQSPPDEVTRQFEHDLNRLLAEAFGQGATIEQTWEITTPVTDAPNWRVRIEKTYSDDAPAYDPCLLDE